MEKVVKSSCVCESTPVGAGSLMNARGLPLHPRALTYLFGVILSEHGVAVCKLINEMNEKMKQGVDLSKPKEKKWLYDKITSLGSETVIDLVLTALGRSDYYHLFIMDFDEEKAA